jgi:hypothetical protein
MWMWKRLWPIDSRICSLLTQVLARFLFVGYFGVFTSTEITVAERDTILYALGIGAARDPLDDSSLKFAYENHPNFAALPTMGNCYLILLISY